jgi:hypothetical protein
MPLVCVCVRNAKTLLHSFPSVNIQTVIPLSSIRRDTPQTEHTKNREKETPFRRVSLIFFLLEKESKKRYA